MISSRAQVLEIRIRGLTALFILGLFLSGVTAIPLRLEVQELVKITGADQGSSGLAHWLMRVRDALDSTETQQPFLFYGTDWLAFGHFMIALVFVGAWRDPVRNRWLFDFGLMACALVIPFAMIFGAARGIPFGWRLIDCSFGILGSIPLWLCRQWARELEKAVTSTGQNP